MPKHSTPTQRASTQAQATSAYAQFMSRAHAMELEAARRYTQFAGQQEADDNIEVAMLFRKPAEIEALHARHILAEMGWQSPPALPPGFAWEGKRGPGDGARRCAAHSDAAVSDSRNRAALQARSAEILREHRSGRRTRTRDGRKDGDQETRARPADSRLAVAGAAAGARRGQLSRARFSRRTVGANSVLPQPGFSTVL